ncbi:hypothetical protein [Allorhodopirellula heiligendammensis]|uniref:Uncharacterized protein n=1 Tax=Allorhodopirellula heiligendammensis TaxID=2714739 RepID=A0A5C6B1F7_9BACT|nr:hypothetical protein [Allorhodopirellula heiligendammensis]TWU05411.1 hypothetical protein Poly21_56750 [Allorhodopirellula heiligendammensis]
MNPYESVLQTEPAESRNWIAWIATSSIARILGAFTGLFTTFGFFGGFQEIAGKMGSDRLGVAIGCCIVATLSFFLCSCYRAMRRRWKPIGSLSITGIFAETTCFTGLLVSLLFVIAPLPSRLLGYPLHDILPWYNDLYLAVIAAPITTVATVEFVRTLKVFHARSK